MSNTLLTLLLLCLFLVAIVSPFSALAGLMLIAVVAIVYWMGLILLRSLAGDGSGGDRSELSE